MTRFKLTRQLTAGFVLIAFSLSETSFVRIASAEPLPPASVSSLPATLSEIQIPVNIGKEEEIRQAPDSKGVVILVQDAHGIPQAQRSIRNLIDFFQQTYGVRQVALEGAASRLNAQIFKSFPDREILKKTFKEYLERGELTGTSMAAIFNEQPGVYQGIEDWKLYEEGYGHFLAAMSKAENIRKTMEAQEKELESRQEKVYSEKLLGVARALKNFRKNGMDLLEVIRVLAAIKAPPEGSELALVYEESLKDPESQVPVDIEAKKIGQQIRDYLLSKPNPSAGDRELLASFNEKFQALKVSEISPQEFMLFVKEITAGMDLKLQVSGGMQRMMRKQKRIKDIEGTRFFEAFEAYADSVKEKLFRSDEERELDSESHRLELLKKLGSMELTRHQWEEFKTLRAGKRADPAILKSHIAFYQNAEARDGVFADRLGELLKKTGEANPSVLFVAGGFHTEGLVERLKERNISYVLLVPDINGLPDEILYKDHMKGLVSWKDYFEVEQGKVDVYKAFVRATRDKMLAKSQDQGRMLKDWRDQIIRDLADEKRIIEVGNYTKFIDEKSGGAPVENQLLQKVEKFVQGLQDLESHNQLNEQNIMRLLRPATIADLTAQGLAEFTFLGTNYKVTQTPSGLSVAEKTEDFNRAGQVYAPPEAAIRMEGQPEAVRAEIRAEDVRKVILTKLATYLIKYVRNNLGSLTDDETKVTDGAAFINNLVAERSGNTAQFIYRIFRQMGVDPTEKRLDGPKIFAFLENQMGTHAATFNKIATFLQTEGLDLEGFGEFMEEQLTTLLGMVLNLNWSHPAAFEAGEGDFFQDIRRVIVTLPEQYADKKKRELEEIQAKEIFGNTATAVAGLWAGWASSFKQDFISNREKGIEALALRAGPAAQWADIKEAVADRVSSILRAHLTDGGIGEIRPNPAIRGTELEDLKRMPLEDLVEPSQKNKLFDFQAAILADLKWYFEHTPRVTPPAAAPQNADAEIGGFIADLLSDLVRDLIARKVPIRVDGVAETGDFLENSRLIYQGLLELSGQILGDPAKQFQGLDLSDAAKQFVRDQFLQLAKREIDQELVFLENRRKLARDPNLTGSTNVEQIMLGVLSTLQEMKAEMRSQPKSGKTKAQLRAEAAQKEEAEKRKEGLATAWLQRLVRALPGGFQIEDLLDWLTERWGEPGAGIAGMITGILTGVATFVGAAMLGPVWGVIAFAVGLYAGALFIFSSIAYIAEENFHPANLRKPSKPDAVVSDLPEPAKAKPAPAKVEPDTRTPFQKKLAWLPLSNPALGLFSRANKRFGPWGAFAVGMAFTAVTVVAGLAVPALFPAMGLLGARISLGIAFYLAIVFVANGGSFLENLDQQKGKRAAAAATADPFAAKEFKFDAGDFKGGFKSRGFGEFLSRLQRAMDMRTDNINIPKAFREAGFTKSRELTARITKIDPQKTQIDFSAEAPSGIHKFTLTIRVDGDKQFVSFKVLPVEQPERNDALPPAATVGTPDETVKAPAVAVPPAAPATPPSSALPARPAPKINPLPPNAAVSSKFRNALAAVQGALQKNMVPSPPQMKLLREAYLAFKDSGATAKDTSDYETAVNTAQERQTAKTAEKDRAKQEYDKALAELDVRLDQVKTATDGIAAAADLKAAHDLFTAAATAYRKFVADFESEGVRVLADTKARLATVTAENTRLAALEKAETKSELRQSPEEARTPAERVNEAPPQQQADQAEIRRVTQLVVHVMEEPGAGSEEVARAAHGTSQIVTGNEMSLDRFIAELKAMALAKQGIIPNANYEAALNYLLDEVLGNYLKTNFPNQAFTLALDVHSESEAADYLEPVQRLKDFISRLIVKGDVGGQGKALRDALGASRLSPVKSFRGIQVLNGGQIVLPAVTPGQFQESLNEGIYGVELIFDDGTDITDPRIRTYAALLQLVLGIMAAANLKDQNALKMKGELLKASLLQNMGVFVQYGDGQMIQPTVNGAGISMKRLSALLINWEARELVQSAA